jgi:serine/threonine protein kinase
MKRERWQQLEQVCQAALDHPLSERTAVLEVACAGDEALRQDAEALLAHEEQAENYLEAPALEVAAEALEQAFFEGLVAFDPSEAAAGAVIGAYHLLQPIGQGGMGEVWLAEQKQPVRRRVAVKLIKAGMDTREVVARFESERQALALMDHMAIAKVFDAGSTPRGRPYFAMEYVPGMPITDYCDQHKLTLRQRLELFVVVCDGVQHAHQKAILHRDLKPSNILVSEADGKPAPRIIDFGVAKATAHQLTADPTLTRAGAIIGTPGYMSPEQADSAGVYVDTRTDVYSLGVVLYELLVGVLPLDFSKREEDAPRPSARLRTLGDQTAITAQNRGADGPTLARQLRGDVDAISLKALEKDRSRRYATPSELAADIGRYFRHEPVLARRAGVGYRARKYIRRHRVGVAVAATAAVLLLSAGVAQTLALRRVTRERDRADRISQFMTGIFQVSDPNARQGNDVRAREILDKASKDIETGLAKDPELQTQMMHVMAKAYEGIILYPMAESLLARAVEIRRRTLGPYSPDTLQSMYELADALNGEGHYREAEKLCRDTIDTRRRVLGPEHRDTLTSIWLLAHILEREGRYPESEELFRKVLEVATRVFGPQDTLSVGAENGLAANLSDENKFSEAEKAYRGLLEVYRRMFGSEHPYVLLCMSNLADVLSSEEKLAEAEKLLQDARQAFRRTLGPEHPRTLFVTGNLAEVLTKEGRYAEAEKLCRESLEVGRKALGPEHRETLEYAYGLGDVLMKDGRFSEAGQLLRQTIEAQRRTLGSEHPDTMQTASDLGQLAMREKRYPEAEKSFREELDGRRHTLGPGHPTTAVAAYNLAATQALQGKREGAFANLQFAFEHELPAENLLALEKDTNLKSLHTDPRFDALVASARQRSAAVPKSK